MNQRSSPSRQRGGFVIGLVVGLLLGLALALGVALYVTKAPNPFVNKVPLRTPGQDAAEIERNRNWDPNSALAGKPPTSTAGRASGAAAGQAPPLAGAAPQVAASGVAMRSPATRDLSAIDRALQSERSPSAPTAGASDPFLYFVQAGAFSRNEDAEQQRAKLAMLGIQSKLTEREQGGRTVYRVRVGPFDSRGDADAAKGRLGDAGVDSSLVRVQR